MLKAKLPTEETQNAVNYHGKKELVDTWKVIATKKGEFHEAVDCRCWMGKSRTASVVHCSIWVHGTGHWMTGRGSAGGYGYHKASAAVGDAIESAGITLWGNVYNGPEDNKKQAHIGGVGETAIVAALEAIARAMGYRKFTVVHS